MKISKLGLYIGVLMVMMGCKLPDYVPNAVDAAESVYGGYINVTLLNGRKIKGELLASNSQRITVIMEGNTNPTQIATEGIRSFKLQFAKSGLEGYAWANLALPITHGKFLVLTLPFNALIISGIASGANEDYRVYSDDTSFEALSQYARYPQGLPPVYLKNSLDK